MQSLPNAPLYFIRHGETDWNVARRFQGQSDIPLNQHGKKQARENAKILAELLSNNSETAGFVSSPLSRASQTAKIIMNELNLSETGLQTNSALQEISFGKWEGLTSAEAKQHYYKERQARRKDRWSIAPPGGESFADRVDDLDKYINSLPAHSIIVSHSGILRIILHLLQKTPPLEAVNIDIPHIGIHIWDGKSLIFAGK